MAEVWDDDENDKCVAAYLEMLAKELAGKKYVKLRYNERMQKETGRSKKSIEFKHNNISAIMKLLGEPWIIGYKPFSNFQLSLVDAVMRGLQGKHWENRGYSPTPAAEFTEKQGSLDGGLVIGPPPSLSPINLSPKEKEEAEYVARKCDVAERDRRNRALGYAGEAMVFQHEKSLLKRIGRKDLAKEVRWVSQDYGDGAGYDISSFDEDGRPRLLEVKTTNGYEKTPFYISKNECDFANSHRDEWRLVRLWDFSRKPKAFSLSPPLEEHVNLIPNSFKGYFS